MGIGERAPREWDDPLGDKLDKLCERIVAALGREPGDPAPETVHYSLGRHKRDAWPEQRSAASFDDFADRILALPRAQSREARTYICGPMRPNGEGRAHREKADLLPRSWLALDLDGGSREECNLMLLRLTDYTAVAWTTARSTPECPRIRILMALGRLVDGGEGERLGPALAGVLGAELASLKWDPSTYKGEQECFLPMVGADVMRYEGDPVDVDAILALAPSVEARPRPAVGPDPYRAALIERGLLLREIGPGKDAIACPFAAEHTEVTSDSSTVYLWPLHGGYKWGHIDCKHAHCAGRKQEDYIRFLGMDPQEVWRGQGRLGDPGTSSAKAPAGDEPRGGEEWSEPQPLIVKVAPEPYPLDALPKTIRAAVEEVHGFTKAPVALVASSALAALSLATQSYIDVRRANKLEGPTGLFLLTIADSGERKTTSDVFFTSSIREYEAKKAESLESELKDKRAAIAGWKAEYEGVLLAIKDKSKKGKVPRDLMEALKELEHCKPEPLRVPKLLRMDDTPESLAWVLAKEWPSAGVVSSEAGIVFGAHAMGKDSITRNLAQLNILWDGGTLPIGRRTSESFTVKGARLTMALQIQEMVLRSFFDQSKGLARGIGFLARFLIAWPESTQGFRPFTEAPENWPDLATFHQGITKILDQKVPIEASGALTPLMLDLTRKAKAEWVAFHDAIEGELRSGGELYDVRDVASKTADNAARLGAQFQVFEHGMGGEIGLEAFEGAGRIVAWHLNESRRFFGELALPVELVDAARLDAWLIEHCRRERTQKVPTKKVQQFGPAGLREKTKIEAAVRELEELGRVRLVPDGRRKKIHVNPALLA